MKKGRISKWLECPDPLVMGLGGGALIVLIPLLLKLVVPVELQRYVPHVLVTLMALCYGAAAIRSVGR